ncbi:SDR family oxidoreductase [Fortiea contorta]|uniref:SDR family oxidoreductase n=1 Tax=Fortiea contorta TaxID=1892405 RepID=UPI00034CBDA6|nr:SDR family oxidoreductase [Fortiea contorta]
MNIAIIGCGYVGYAVAQYWQQNQNFNITATTTTPGRVPHLNVVAQKVVVAQGNNPEQLKAALQNQDVVLLSVGAKGVNVYEETYLETAKTIASILPEFPTIKQLIYTGSYAVYGNKKGAVVDEQTATAPSNNNGRILQATEAVLLSAATANQRVCILRLGGIYGPGRELIKIFGRAAGTTRPGNGEDVTNWIHLDDIVGAIDFVREQQLSGIYNLVDDAHLSSRDLLDNVFKTHNLPTVTWDTSLESDRVYNSWVSNQKIKDAGYQLLQPQMIF